ncbi:MAG TPA: SAM-dependent methyltransferase [Verrucomicrobiae bacterium]|nr:SAM-dependent methyltransferase [Verrucomicrobiae bacterium]
MSQLAEKIAQLIQNRGCISFARFMHLALYCPVYGYYEKEPDNIGRRGDYFTSVSVGGLFGELLACQFAGWLEELTAATDPRPGPLALVEAGAHRGELARDILNWLRQHRSALFERTRYWIVEPSARRQQWQQATLAEFGDKVCWVPSLGAAAQGTQGPENSAPLRGVIFSNELLDAFPVHRLGWDRTRQEWFEWGVTSEQGHFRWTRLEPPRWLLQCCRRQIPVTELEALKPVLPDGFTVEIAPSATRWWRCAAQRLGAGKLMTIDYGLTRNELLLPHRTAGTLRAYRQHQLSPDVLADPGEQDLTAHVNFAALETAGLGVGLQPSQLTTQAQFLTGIAARTWSGEWEFGEWTPERRRQFQTLTHPQHLGQAFRVLVQGRG